MSRITPLVSISRLIQLHAQMERRGVVYGYGVKPTSLDEPFEKITAIDCSGYSRYAIYQASGGGLTIPDGSQAQREFFEEGGYHKLKNYSDANSFATPGRLFISFIKPFENGCGKVGHVWLLHKDSSGNPTETIESCGGRGVTSRPWNTLVLRKEVYETFELPALL